MEYEKKLCPKCGKEMEIGDNVAFLSDGIHTQLFSFTPTVYICFDCNLVIPIKK